MTKVLKFIGKTMLGIIEWIVILLTVFAFAIRAPYVQTLIAQKVTDYLSTQLERKISIGRVDFLFYNKLILDDVYVDDVNRDTLASIKQINVSLNYLLIQGRHLNLKNVELNQGSAFLKRDSVTHAFNFQYLVDYFSPKEKTKSKPFKITIQNLSIADFHFKMDDETKIHQPFGVDYGHIDGTKIYLSAKNIQINGIDISANVKHISLHEKSGFKLAKLATDVRLTQRGLFLKKTTIITDKSSIDMPKLYFFMNGLDKFSHFIDEVTFDAYLKYSQIDMKDVSYFATVLEGMDEVIKIGATVKDKVKNLKINNLKLDIRENTTLQGNFTLPDFRNLENEQIKQEIKYAFFNIHEINQVKLPLGNGVKTLGLNDLVQRFGYAELKDVTTSGKLKNLFVQLNQLKTAIGTIQINHDINIFQENEHTIAFREVHGGDNELPIAIQNFDLGRLLDQKQFGIVDGNIHLDGRYSSKTGIALENINGLMNRLDFNGYNYSAISLKNLSYAQNVINGKVAIKDPNLDFDFDGEIDLNKEQSYRAKLEINKAYLNKLKLFNSDSLFAVRGTITTDICGGNINLYSGIIQIDSLTIINGNKQFYAKESHIELTNSDTYNAIALQSDILDATISGNIDYSSFATHLTNTLAYSFPAFISQSKVSKTAKPTKLDYLFNLKNINPILNIFVPDLYVATGTKILGEFNSQEENLSVNVQAGLLKFSNYKIDDFDLKSNFEKTGLRTNINLLKFHLNDSIMFGNVTYGADGNTDDLNSLLTWDLNTPDASELKWKTRITDLNDIVLEIEKSYFTINEHRWEIKNDTYFSYCHKEMDVRNFLLSYENQFILIDGKISENPDDKLDVVLKDLDLKDITSILSVQKDVRGIANGDFHLSNIFDSPRVHGDLKVQSLILEQSEIGDVDLQGVWDNYKKAINVNGNLVYRGVKTFNIVGDYYLERENDNLDFKLKFDKTNIAFLNSFMDEKVISNIKGDLDGFLVVKGEIAKPQVTGYLDLSKGNVKVGMFGVNYGFNGKVKVSEDMIQIDNMPLIDEEGNKGFLNGAIIHENFSNFNFDVFVGLDNIKKANGDEGSFLAMNTHYEEGAIYFGKAYVNGWVNVDGYLDNLNIEVNLKTNKNTTITIPLYGAEEIDDILSYSIVENDSLKVNVVNEKVDLTGVNLNLNFDLTPDALIKLVFDDKTGDEITANGSGKITIKLNSNNDLSMDGKYTISKGAYNFVFPPIPKKEFKVESGSEISWKGGSPTDADMNILAVYKANADLSVITTDLESQRSAGSTQVVDAKIYLTGNLDAPKMSFELAAPKASESAKAALSRINSDNDELNKQFFMLLLSGRFQGSGVSASDYGSNAALEALTGQINGLLDAVSKDVRLNVDLKRNEQTGQSSQAVGIEKSFLDDKLIIKGNFGVQNQNDGKASSSSFIGDINLEYIIDDAGNLRVSIFNESNNYNVMQDKNLGPFTQGIGLIYTESFNNFKEMNLYNFVADWFRKDKHFKYTKHRRQKYLPEYQKVGVKEED